MVVMHQEMEVEVFRAGDYGDKGRWSEADIAQIADDYDPAAHEAPVTIDHAQSGPAWGWVRGLRAAGPVLMATLAQVSDELHAWLGEGRFKKRSIELYPALPATGRPYLRAVSFLGAAAPEVKGLADPLFSDDAAGVLHLPYDEGEEPPAAGAAVPSPTPPPPPKTPTVSASMSESAPPDVSLSPIPSIPADPFAVRRAVETECRELEREGRLPPAWRRAGVVAFMEALRAAEIHSTLNYLMLNDTALKQSAPLCFGEDGAASPYLWFLRFLQSLPPVIPLAEFTPAFAAAFEPAPPPPGVPVSARVDAASLERHRRALALQAVTPALRYSEALLKSCEN